MLNLGLDPFMICMQFIKENRSFGQRLSRKRKILLKRFYRNAPIRSVRMASC